MLKHSENPLSVSFKDAGGKKLKLQEQIAQLEIINIETIEDLLKDKNEADKPEVLDELARISDFRIVKVEKRDLETGQADENLYYILEKI